MIMTWSENKRGLKRDKGRRKHRREEGERKEKERREGEKGEGREPTQRKKDAFSSSSRALGSLCVP